MEELVDVLDERGMYTGKTETRANCSKEGLWHKAVCVFIINSKSQVLLQKRSEQKDSFPGCYDISSAGHIPAGSDYIPSAVRELKEELGVDMNGDELIYCGQRRFRFEREFHGSMFRDNQVSNVYALWLDREEEDFILQEEEVSGVRWMDFADCVSAVRENRISHCIYMEELELLKNALHLH